MPPKKRNPAQAGSGSPAGEPVYLVIGFLRRPHGLRGEIIMDLHTDFPERLKRGRRVFVGEAHRSMSLEGVRPHGKGVLIKLRGVDNSEEAGLYRNQWVSVKTADVPALPVGQVYQYQLLGLSVLDERDIRLGQITEIIETGANDVYVVTDDSGHELLLPAIPSVILELDMDRRIMHVHVLEGL
jgi:16S rRNA processing protein RimM